MNKKKIIIATAVIVIVIVALICVFANSKSEEIVNANDVLGEIAEIEEKPKLELTDEMLKEIKAKINDEHYELMTLTVIKLVYKLEDYNYTDFVITNKKQTDDYTYKVYAKLYYEDNYGGSYYDTMNVVYTVEEDAEEEKGYSIKTDYEFSSK